MSSNSSITSWTPGNLEFVSYVEIFISSFPSFQIGSFLHILIFLFLCLLLCPNFLFCFYGYCSSWALKDFNQTYFKVIFTLLYSIFIEWIYLLLVDLAGVFFHHFCLFVILLCRLILNGIITFLSKLLILWFLPPMTLFSASAHSRAYICGSEF